MEDGWGECGSQTGNWKLAGAPAVFSSESLCLTVSDTVCACVVYVCARLQEYARIFFLIHDGKTEQVNGQRQ